MVGQSASPSIVRPPLLPEHAVMKADVNPTSRKKEIRTAATDHRRGKKAALRAAGTGLLELTIGKLATARALAVATEAALPGDVAGTTIAALGGEKG